MQRIERAQEMASKSIDQLMRDDGMTIRQRLHLETAAADIFGEVGQRGALVAGVQLAGATAPLQMQRNSTTPKRLIRTRGNRPRNASSSSEPASSM